MNKPNSSPTKPVPKTPSKFGFEPPEALLWGMYLGVIFTLLTTLALADGDIASWKFWGVDGNKSETLRNLGLVALGVIGLPLAIWRSITAFRQAETANRQANLAEKGLIIDRFQKGAQMLESSELSVRLAGIYALRELATSDPDETYLLVLDLLCDFVRERSKTRVISTNAVPGLTSPIYRPFPPDQLKALETISYLRKNIPFASEHEQQKNWTPDLCNAVFAETNLTGLYLANAYFREVNFENAKVMGTDMSGSNLSGANLTGIKCRHVSFNGATLSRAKISCAAFNVVNFESAKFRYANIINSRIKEANLRKTDFFHSNLTEVRFEFSEITGARGSMAKTNGCSFTKIWAYEKSLTLGFGQDLYQKIRWRRNGETWEDFQDRMHLEGPEVAENPSDFELDPILE